MTPIRAQPSRSKRGGCSPSYGVIPGDDPGECPYALLQAVGPCQHPWCPAPCAPTIRGEAMLEPISAQRFVVMLRRVDLLRPIVKLFEQEGAARGYWRTAAIAAAVGTPIDGHL